MLGATANPIVLHYFRIRSFKHQQGVAEYTDPRYVGERLGHSFTVAEENSIANHQSHIKVTGKQLVGFHA